SAENALQKKNKKQREREMGKKTDCKSEQDWHAHRVCVWSHTQPMNTWQYRLMILAICKHTTSRAFVKCRRSTRARGRTTQKKKKKTKRKTNKRTRKKKENARRRERMEPRMRERREKQRAKAARNSTHKSARQTHMIVARLLHNNVLSAARQRLFVSQCCVRI